MGLMCNLLRQARQRPEDIVLADSAGQSMTYAQLATAACSGAARLHDAGIAPGDRVLVGLPNGFDFVQAYYSVIASGAIAVPVNPRFRASEIGRIARDSGAVAAIAEPGAGAHVEGIALTCADLADDATCEAVVAGRPESGATVILYTSGTTGRPRGAMLSGEGLACNAQAMGEISSARPQDVHLCTLPLYHSFGATVSMNMPIATGGKIVFARQFIPAGVARLIRSVRGTVWAGVPAMFAAMAECESIDRDDLCSLRMCISGGAALSDRVFHVFKQRFGIEIAEGYGLTEASPVVTATRAGDRVVAGTVGPPIPGVSVRIVDESGEEAMRGQAGEVHASGPGVMLGYYDCPEQTRQVLRDGWVRTGDIGLIDAHGYLRILDRRSDVINTAGFKVYPAEVEETIRQHPAVSEVLVVGQPHPIRGEVVVAHAQLNPGCNASEREIVLFCRRRLADYKAPAVVVFHEALPADEMGKPLRKLVRLAQEPVHAVEEPGRQGAAGPSDPGAKEMKALNRDDALAAVRANVSNINLVKHMVAAEVCMRALAGRFGEDEHKWGLAGLLHDIDYDSAGSDPARHSLVGAEMLEKMDVHPDVIYAVRVHNDCHGLPRISAMDKALYAVDPLTGLIVAAALIHPAKKLAAIDVGFVVNRYHEKGFARGAKREQIALCSELDMELSDFVEVCLEAMQQHAAELGL
jgi:long-chain acyl-CoA synthetase